ncbi:unnamed protein product [Adineta steineri]|uniref:Uncharacterized protein n=1 Tax=Adineta steineri TaxID=433720 RepID=A0A818ZKF7_9BILA|nr:unnamed protein product [Adineta steineri]CAF1404653.1 unnamed protein product [Adineta steineri]CAF3773382.1 unnamed protein product [Adineta steineri]CAF3814038.1 unnamed protein product [Adineta steineri]
MVSCKVCMQSVVMNLIILVWSLMLDGYFIRENSGIKKGLVYCDLEGWILPAYSFFTSIGIILACVQLILLIFCCGCLKAEECLRVRSYTIDLLWAIAKEVPQIMIIFHVNLCRDGWFKMSSLFKAIFSICVTIWKLYNLYTFLRNDVKSEDIPQWCRAKRLYICFPIFLIPIWLVNLALSIMIAILFIHRHHGEGYIKIPGSIHKLHVQDKYLYTKYIARSGIYLRWPDNNYNDSYMKLAEIDYIMANKKTTVHLVFKLPYVCFERSLLDRTPNQCFKLDEHTKTLSIISMNEFSQSYTNQKEQNATFTFRYKLQSNKYNLGQINYNGNVSFGSLFLDQLLYFRLHHANAQDNDDDFLYRTSVNNYQFYRNHHQLISIDKAWRYGFGKCRPCVIGPQLSTH